MIEIVEVINTTVQGYTNPALCVGSDGKQYIVKGRQALNDGLIKEYICASLGKLFEIPVPAFEIVTFPDELFEYDEDLMRRFSGAPCFASNYLPQVQEFDRTSYKKEYAQFFRDLFVFDYWIKNDDRNFTVENGGNPNLIVDVERSEISVIDHNLAFDSEFSVESFKLFHVGTQFWQQPNTDWVNENNYENRIHTAVKELDNLVDNIPDEWISNGSTLLERITEQLIIKNTNDFWSQIR